MPTTASSNNPHVRITPDTHEKVRLLSFVLKMSQGDLIDLLADEKLEALGNPYVHVPPRQAPKEAPVPATTRRRAKEAAPAVSKRRTRAAV